MGLTTNPPGGFGTRPLGGDVASLVEAPRITIISIVVTVPVLKDQRISHSDNVMRMKDVSVDKISYLTRQVEELNLPTDGR
jgi:hypothetical protein